MRNEMLWYVYFIHNSYKKSYHLIALTLSLVSITFCFHSVRNSPCFDAVLEIRKG